MTIDISQRKLDLMKRDEEVRAFEKKLKNWCDFQENLLRKKKDYSSAFYASHIYDMAIKEKPLRKLKEEIEKKWCVKIKTYDGKLSLVKKIIDESCVDDAKDPTSLICHELKSMLRKNPPPPGGLIYHLLIKWGHKFLPFDPKDEIPIIIDISTLTQNDSGKVGREVGEMIKRAIKKRQRNKGNPSAPTLEPKELRFLYHTKDETFKKYLAWYDYYINWKLPIRIIAIIKSSVNKNKILKKIETMGKIPTINSPVSGERTVAYGLKKIYEAIHRKSFTLNKKNLFTFSPGEIPYNCPDHGQNCLPDHPKCKYLSDYLKAVYKNVSLRELQYDPDIIQTRPVLSKDALFLQNKKEGEYPYNGFWRAESNKETKIKK